MTRGTNPGLCFQTREVLRGPLLISSIHRGFDRVERSAASKTRRIAAEVVQSGIKMLHESCQWQAPAPSMTCLRELTAKLRGRLGQDSPHRIVDTSVATMVRVG